MDDLASFHGAPAEVVPPAQMRRRRWSRREGGRPRIVIIGAGPTGLDAGYRLQELGCQNWDILEANDTVLGSWVTSVSPMEELMGLLVRWDLHPGRTVSHRSPLDQAAAAYATADTGADGKVALVMDQVGIDTVAPVVGQG